VVRQAEFADLVAQQRLLGIGIVGEAQLVLQRLRQRGHIQARADELVGQDGAQRAADGDDGHAPARAPVAASLVAPEAEGVRWGRSRDWAAALGTCRTAAESVATAKPKMIRPSRQTTVTWRLMRKKIQPCTHTPCRGRIRSATQKTTLGTGG